MDIIDRINLELSKLGKTGAEMCRELGLSNSIYSQWNTKKSKPSPKTLLRLANYFDVSVEYLLYGAAMGATDDAAGLSEINGDEKIAHYLERLRSDYRTRMLMDVTENMNADDMEQMAAFARFLRREK